MNQNNAPSILDFVTCRRAAIGHVRALADSIIEQRERLARGWDASGIRDDVPSYARMSAPTVYHTMRTRSAEAFAVAAAFRA